MPCRLQVEVSHSKSHQVARLTTSRPLLTLKLRLVTLLQGSHLAPGPFYCVAFPSLSPTYQPSL